MAQTFDLRTWIREQPHKGYEANLADDDHFVLQTDYATAEISFYDMAPDPEIVELRIEDRATGEARFFLHFHPVDRDHSIQLFGEMVQALVSIRSHQRTEVLLCCTAGMTTSFFAERLNQVAEAMGLDWVFSAVSVTEAYEHGRNKAAILIAPQIGYQAQRVQQVMGDVPVFQIPTAMFAAYDAAGCLEWIREELASREQEAAEQADVQTCAQVEGDGRILVVAVHAASGKVTIHYRVYDRGTLATEGRVIKRRLTVADITDVIDTRICSCKAGGKVDAVGVALPGALRGGYVHIKVTREVDLTNGEDGFVLGDYLSKRYTVPVVLCNNANAAALGWHVANPKYKDVTFYSQATGWAMGGQGHVVGGKLVEGAHGNAGEIRLIANRFSYSNPLHYNAFNPADVIEVVAQVLAMDCATFDPEVIALRCDLLPDMDEVATELAKYVAREQQPKLVHVFDYDECILVGMLARCRQELWA
ncbi:MAG: ROK family protein [Coriobacteriales bacterium]|nr:ROK family protein [Coriobacteriales bacterium]